MNNRFFIIESSLSWIYRIVDLVVTILMLYVIAFILQVEWNNNYTALSIIAGLLFLIISQSIGSYRKSHLKQSIIEFSKLIIPWIIAWIMVIIGLFLLKISDFFSRITLVSWLIFSPITIVIGKLLFQKLLIVVNQHFIAPTKVAIVSINTVGERFIYAINQVVANVQLECIYLNQNNPSSKEYSFLHPHVKSNIEALIYKIKNNHYDEIYMCLPLKEQETIDILIEQFSDTTVTVKLIPDMFSLGLMHNKISDIDGLPVFSIYDTPLNSLFNRFIKRVSDIVLSAIILLFISPLMLILALGVKITSSGPILFKQQRYGLNGKKINIYKFRSMTVMDNGNDVKQAGRNDIRITPYGKIMRAFSLDEFPQFINVLQGKMSIVGPRPHASIHNEQYRKIISKYMQRHMVKPGITGWAQINGLRGETQTIDKMEQRIEYDLYYIKNWSLLLDLRIIMTTALKGFFDKNAY